VARRREGQEPSFAGGDQSLRGGRADAPMPSGTAWAIRGGRELSRPVDRDSSTSITDGRLAAAGGTSTIASVAARGRPGRPGPERHRIADDPDIGRHVSGRRAICSNHDEDLARPGTDRVDGVLEERPAVD
jgi:hypothetical protein